MSEDYETKLDRIRRLEEEIERLAEERNEYKQRFEWNFDRRHAAENEARLKGEAIIQMQYRLDAMEKQMEAAEAGHRMQTRATLGFRQDWLDTKAEAQRLRGALEMIARNGGYPNHTWEGKIARSALEPRVSDENRNGSDPEGLRSEGLPARCHNVTDALTLSPKEQKGE